MNAPTIFDQIQAEAKRQGVSSAELARRAGLLPQSVSRMVRSGSATLGNVDALAGALGMKLALAPRSDLAQALLAGTLF